MTANTTTQQQDLEALLTRFGVGFERRGEALVCNELSDRVNAYPGFYASFEFDSNGNFLRLKLRE